MVIRDNENTKKHLWWYLRVTLVYWNPTIFTVLDTEVLQIQDGKRNRKAKCILYTMWEFESFLERLVLASPTSGRQTGKGFKLHRAADLFGIDRFKWWCNIVIIVILIVIPVVIHPNHVFVINAKASYHVLSVFSQKQTKGPKPSEMTTSLVSNPRYIQAIRYIMLAPALVPSIKVKPQLWGLSSALAWKLPKCPDLTSIYYNYGCENADQTVQAARMPLRHMIWCLDKSNALTISLKKILDRYKTVAQLT